MTGRRTKGTGLLPALLSAAAALLTTTAGHAQTGPAAALPAPSATVPDTTEALAQLSQLAWLGGCWRSDGGEAGTVEHWLPPVAGTMMGVSRTVRRGRTAAFEFMQIRPGEDGRLGFVAQPSGKPPTLFPVLRFTPSEVVFENPGHDFPQRVIYRQDAPDHLRARIEGMSRGAARGIEYPMSKVACEAPALGVPPR